MSPSLRASTVAKSENSKASLGIVYEWMKDAEAGLANSQYNLGMAYFLRSGGFPRSKKKALYWLEKAALQGHESAAWVCEMMYERVKI